MASTATAPTPPPAAPKPPPPPAPASCAKGLPSKVYNLIVNKIDPHVPNKLRPLWLHPAGPKTVFFWSPICKWGLVIAGIGDLARPAESLSVPQCAALAATGIIWSRYSLVIIPKNWGLFSVNLFVGLTQCIQLGRAYLASEEKKKRLAAGVEAEPTEPAVPAKQAQPEKQKK